MDESPARPSSAEAARTARRNRISGVSPSPSAKGAAAGTGRINSRIESVGGSGTGTSGSSSAVGGRSAISGRAKRRAERSLHSSGRGSGNQRASSATNATSTTPRAGVGASTGGTASRTGRTPSQSPADVVAAFDQLAPASTSSSQLPSTSATVARTGRPSAGGGHAEVVASKGASAAVDLSPEAVAKEFVTRRQQQRHHYQRQHVVSHNATATATASSSSAAATNGHYASHSSYNAASATADATMLPKLNSPTRSRNAAAARNYVSGRAQSPLSDGRGPGTNARAGAGTGTGRTGNAVISASSATGAASTAAASAAVQGGTNTATTSAPSATSSPMRYTRTTMNALQKKKQMQVDTSRRARAAAEGVGGAQNKTSFPAGSGVSRPATSPANVASPGTHVGSVGSSSVGSRASPDSLAYSNTHSFSKSSRSTGGEGSGEGGGGDVLGGKETNDIPSPERRKQKRQWQQQVSKVRTKSAQQQQQQQQQQQMSSAQPTLTPDTTASE